VAIEGAAHELPAVAKTVLFRIAQEALTNIAKHAQAGRVAVLLRFGAEGGVALQVTDDGQGFDSEAVHSHPERGLGLRSMRERLAAIGGQLQVESRPGHGTQIEAEVPAAALAKLGGE
jgi:two-component system NarL family sensor kinase